MLTNKMITMLANKWSNLNPKTAHLIVFHSRWIKYVCLNKGPQVHNIIERRRKLMGLITCEKIGIWKNTLWHLQHPNKVLDNSAGRNRPGRRCWWWLMVLLTMMMVVMAVILKRIRVGGEAHKDTALGCPASRNRTGLEEHVETHKL